MMKATEKGQSLIETALIFPLLILFVLPAIFATFHLIYFKITAKHLLYENLICRETKFRESTCHQSLQQQLRSTLIGGKLLHFYHQKNSHESSLDARFQTWYAKEIKIYEKIRLPLQ